MPFGTVITIPQMYALALRHGFTPLGAVYATAVALAESSLDTCNESYLYVDDWAGHHSCCTGLFQIYWSIHGVSKAQTCDPDFATQWAFDHSDGGHRWHNTWESWDAGTAQHYIPQIEAVMHLPQTVPPPPGAPWVDVGEPPRHNTTPRIPFTLSADLQPLSGALQSVLDAFFVLTDQLGMQIPIQTIIPQGSRLYTVVAGDSLSSIAAALCGDAGKWVNIYAANQGIIGSDPNMIEPGMILNLPC